MSVHTHHSGMDKDGKFQRMMFCRAMNSPQSLRGFADMAQRVESIKQGGISGKRNVYAVLVESEDAGAE